jgi:hypothetical protein
MLDHYWLSDGLNFDTQTNVLNLVGYFVGLALKRDSKSSDNEQGNSDDLKEKYIIHIPSL